jgi:mannose-6-phosphate isomerase
MEIYQTPKPWGTYEVLLDDKLTKVKRITVYPGHRLSLQSHEHRQEQWTIIEGKLTVVLGDEQLIFYPGESVHIPLGAKHRAWNKGDEIVQFIEVQTGTYFGEDDITRYEDDYGRDGDGIESKMTITAIIDSKQHC